MNFYDSIIEGAQELAPVERGQLYTACLEYLYYGGRMPELDKMRATPRAMFVMMRPVLDNQLSAQERGRKGGRPRKAESQAKPEVSESAAESESQTKPEVFENGAFSKSEQEQEIEELSPNGDSKKRDEFAERRRQVIAHLNAATGSHFKPNADVTRRHLDARLREGYAVEDCKRVVDTKAAQWLGTDMAKYLRPETLFGAKFEGYLNEPAPGVAHEADDEWSAYATGGGADALGA